MRTLKTLSLSVCSVVLASGFAMGGAVLIDTFDSAPLSGLPSPDDGPAQSIIYFNFGPPGTQTSAINPGPQTITSGSVNETRELTGSSPTMPLLQVTQMSVNTTTEALEFSHSSGSPQVNWGVEWVPLGGTFDVDNELSEYSPFTQYLIAVDVQLLGIPSGESVGLEFVMTSAGGTATYSGTLDETTAPGIVHLTLDNIALTPDATAINQFNLNVTMPVTPGGGGIQLLIGEINVIPEPSQITLVGLSIIGLCLRRRRPQS